MRKRSMSEISYMFDVWVCRDKKLNVLCFENKPVLFDEEWVDPLDGMLFVLPPEVAYFSDDDLIKAEPKDYHIKTYPVLGEFRRMYVDWG